MTEILNVGDGKVVLLAGGGKIFTDIASRFVGSERSLEDIVASDYDRGIVEKILNSNHLAATEFDYFVFGIEGYARVTEIQLVRKRLASYLIKSGRINKGGKRRFTAVLPQRIRSFEAPITIRDTQLTLNADDIHSIIEQWYSYGVDIGLPEEELRYCKTQGTEFKAIIGMNAHALIEWFRIRTCRNAQTEIRDLATKMLNLCRRAAPDLFWNAGPSCRHYGYCPENDRQNLLCRGAIITKCQALALIEQHQGEYSIRPQSTQE